MRGSGDYISMIKVAILVPDKNTFYWFY